MIRIWTVGHSNHSFERFASLLAAPRIELVADVRSRPYSRFAPWSGRERLKTALAERGIDYEFVGDALGGRPESADHYDSAGHALYGRMAEEPAFQEAIGVLLHVARARRVALMCSEGDPQSCHRRLLIGKVLCERGAVMEHILTGGEVRPERHVPIAGEEALFGAGAWRSLRPVSRIHARPGA